MLISICIPAYKRPANIERLLSSIRDQDFKDYEIIVTDDSPDDSVREVLAGFSELPMQYFKNPSSLGTPANWNFAISKAKGEWIKLMHDDDWFARRNSLQRFADETSKNTKFIFSAYTNVIAPSERKEAVFMSAKRGHKIIVNPSLLIVENIIGPPSVTLVHRSISDQYDERMKWRVDIDFYMRVIEKEQDFSYINEPLINVGISDTQVTNYCINQPDVELPEAFFLLQKTGIKTLGNIWVYDAWWRLMRNVQVRDIARLDQFVPGGKWPVAIYQMVKHQSKIPASVLKTGVFSKMAMTASYILNLPNLKRRK